MTDTTTDSMEHGTAAGARTGAGAGRPAAVLWDFDGTLVDTEPIWMRAQYALVDSLGGQWSEAHAHNMVGNSLIDSGRYVVDVLGRPDLSPEWVVDELIVQVLAEIRRSEIPWRPGAQRLLASLAASGVPCALVSASYRVLLDAVLDRLPAGSFARVVAGDDVEHGKPHPEPYLTACAELGVSPGECVVLEDSTPGCASGTAAGCVVVGIHNLVDLAPAPRRVLIDTLDGVGAEDLFALYRGASSGARRTGAS